MTSLDYAIVKEPAENYVVTCHACARKFNALATTWCRCESKTRTLTCPYCSTCFCNAVVGYKQKFWEEAPRALRESTNRFRVGDGSISVQAEAAAAPAALRRPRVLIVDDEEVMRSLTVCYVEQMGYDVISVSTPTDALNLLAATSFEVVITDALMPEMDGRELCRTVKKLYGDEMKVIVMTSLYTASRYRTEARYKFGVDDYLAKPLQFGVLKAALDRIAPVSPPAHS